MFDWLRRLLRRPARARAEHPPVRPVTLTDGRAVYPGFDELKPNGQQRDYVVLSAEERARGFVRPVRDSYVHLGLPGPKYPLRPTIAGERGSDPEAEWYEAYPASELPAVGRFWTQAELDRVGRGCGAVTKMGRAIAETYARDPHFYGATFCVGCRTHLPVGRDGEFVWDDGSGQRVGT